MPWEDNKGNGKGNGGGPWGNSGGNGGNGGNNGNGQKPNRPGNNDPDIEDLLKSGQERMRRAMGGGGGGRPNGTQSGGGLPFSSNLIFTLAFIAILGFWLFSGVYTINPGERGVITTFGKYERIAPPGLGWRVPSPIQQVSKVNVEQERSVDVGEKTETLMLTSDRNIISVEMTVNWQIQPDGGDGLPNAYKYIYNIEAPERLLRSLAESSLREVIGENEFDRLISIDRSIVSDKTKETMQRALDEYDSGIQIIRVNLKEARPPAPVIPAQDKVNDAGSQAQKLINQATGYANERIPVAEAEAERITLQAEEYAARELADARGKAERFESILREYRKAPEVTRQRMYIETMEKVMTKSDVIIMDEGSNAVPYLPLNELKKNNQ